MNIVNSKSRFFFALVALVGGVAQLYIFRQYYWVIGNAAYGQALLLFALLIIPALSIAFIRRREELALFVLAISLILSSVWIMPKILRLQQIKDEIIQLAASLQTQKGESGKFPETINLAQYLFRDPSIAKCIQSYQVEEEKFWIVFSGPDPAVSYTFSSDGKLTFNDD